MRKEIIDYLETKTDLQKFVREQPIWYRKLSRNPFDLESLEIASLHHYKRTVPHQVEKFTNGVQMASMMFHMFQSMKNQN
ncbi:YlbE-like family protein [Neobacillus sp. PS3-34]|uniref:YlbE-like family protein n=1 Tax=Neobacillus sp. PS3-34 TaxID=3070678 RepID=UPI0027E02DA8|nr:YlbE-like family protein [Neobacillus sp. PS3-34]WML49370.1 YlbE-like family protein [Neobacillus sp. PS3-34]